jgi:hypothetical protein
VQQILTMKCGTAMCHNGTVMHVDLRAQGLYKALTTPMTKGDCQGKTIVDTAQLGNTILGQIIQTGIPAGTCGSKAIARMPNGCAGDSSKCLSQAQIDTITSWISGGAKEM